MQLELPVTGSELKPVVGQSSTKSHICVAVSGFCIG